MESAAVGGGGLQNTRAVKQEMHIQFLLDTWRRIKRNINTELTETVCELD